MSESGRDYYDMKAKRNKIVDLLDSSIDKVSTDPTRALADILAGDAEDPGARQASLMLGQAALRRLINETPIEPGNDPHGERDFGAAEFQGRKIFWKIDVYANDGTFAWGSEVPWDAQQSFRVVTVMLASDW